MADDVMRISGAVARNKTLIRFGSSLNAVGVAVALVLSTVCSFQARALKSDGWWINSSEGDIAWFGLWTALGIAAVVALLGLVIWRVGSEPARSMVVRRSSITVGLLLVATVIAITVNATWVAPVSG